MRSIPDAALRQMLIQMTQTGQVGTPEYLLAAGEIQSRKDARAKAMAGQGNPTPVIADLLTGGAMPPQMQPQMQPQMPMLPENAGGVAALPAPNMDNVAEMAAGGIVAFQKAGSVYSDAALLEDAIKKLKIRDPNFNEGFLRTALADASDTQKSKLMEGLRAKAGEVAAGQSDVLPGIAPAAPATGMSLSDVMRQATMDERRYYQQTGQLPGRLQQMLRGEIQPPAAPTGPGRQTAFSVDGPDLPPARFSDTQRFYPGIAPLVQRQQNAPSVTGMPTSTADFRAQMRQADNAGLAALAQQAGQIQGQQGQQGPTVREINPTAPAAAPAAAAMPQLSYEDAFNQAQGFAKTLLPDLPAEEAVDPKKMIQDRNQLYKDLGIADPTTMRREQLDKEIKNAKSEKEQAGWMRLAEFGFNWASQNGPTLQAAAKAGAAVAPGLMSDLKDLRKIERDQQKELAGLAALDAQAQRATADSVLAEIQKQRERRETRIENLETRRATVAASVAGNVISAGTQREVAGMQASALKDERDLARKDKRAQVALDSAEQAAREILDPTERTNAIKRYFRAFYDVAYGEGATAPARAQGRVVNGVYVPAGQ
jgi:hypothetical protein